MPLLRNPCHPHRIVERPPPEPYRRESIVNRRQREDRPHWIAHPERLARDNGCRLRAPVIQNHPWHRDAVFGPAKLPLFTTSPMPISPYESCDYSQRRAPPGKSSAILGSGDILCLVAISQRTFHR